MRRTFGLFFLSLSLGLLAVAPPKPATSPPTPQASIAPAPGTFTSSAPSVVVYPFETPSDVNKNTGQAIAQIYAQVLVQSGGLTVLAIPKGIRREDYAKYAHSKGADYYISGYVQPIGASAAIVAQVVDVNNDISVYSQTTQIQSVPEVASQALDARAVIMRAAGIEQPDIVTQQATPAPSATQGASLSITNVLGDLFKGHHKGATPAPVAVAKKPSRGVIVARLTGSATTGDLTRGTQDLQRILASAFNVTTTQVFSNAVANEANSICGMHRDNTIASGVLDATRIGGFRPHESYTFVLRIYTCFGSVLYTTTSTNDDFSRAIGEAVDTYAKAHPHNE